jgi:hypothetical protein
MAAQVRNNQNQELTKLIGRRLRESLGDDSGDLPTAIQDGLDAVRRAEKLEAMRDRPMMVDIGEGGGTEAGHGMSAYAAEGSRETSS